MVGVMPSRSQRGSSPRGRGGRDRRGRPRERQGLIPARAGRSPRTRHRKTRPWAHPRAGGAVQQCTGLDGGRGGSSPRGRGGLQLRLLPRGRPGLIPARAGRSSARARSAAPARAHPRAGGAVQQCTGLDCGRWGSSPRGRGGPACGGPADSLRGLIPARAGRSKNNPRHKGGGRAHPRAGGAVARAGQITAHVPGSSPRGRGGPVSLGSVRAARGLIPARAGRSHADQG